MLVGTNKCITVQITIYVYQETENQKNVTFLATNFVLKVNYQHLYIDNFTDTLYCMFLYNKSFFGMFHIIFVIQIGRNIELINLAL